MKLLFDEDLRENIITIIDNAIKKLTLVSPYILLRESKELITKIKEKELKGIRIEIHTNTKELENAKYYFKDINCDNIYTHRNLHAKLYFNESKAIVTTLNLIDYSIKNNIEIGFITENDEEYNKIVNDFYFPKLINDSNENIFLYRLNIIDNMLNEKGNYFIINRNYIQDEELLIEHEKYKIILSGKHTYNYRIILKENKYCEKLKHFEKTIKKYLYAWIYIEDDLTLGIIFENDFRFTKIYDAILSDHFYNIVNKLYHIKSTLAHLFYKR